MIVTHIAGGMGNQMFQLAAGVALASRLGVELRLDTRYYNRRIPVELDLRLQHFGHGAREANPRDIPYLKGDTFGRFVGSKFHKPCLSAFNDMRLPYNPAFETLGDDTYLKGYWQSERYYAGQEDKVRRALTFVTPPNDENARALDVILSKPSVSLHIRRAAYVSVPKFNAIHGTCSPEYYAQAVEHIAANMAEEPVFVAFSDEPDWVRENIKIPFELHVMGHNGGATNYEDLRLMSRCRHHIVANSSFSWWGAWLNPDPDKMVVAPERWFADPSMQVHDIVPEDWIRM
ncbi:MAG: alpha-1,2-fucosyltransferase [Pseudomonadales bacterium]|nr:alpha-1,2-fucosyltransferase [Pseudomonadales bacterium]